MARTPPPLTRPRLTTRRLLLWPVKPRFAPVMYEAIEESRSRLRRWLPFPDQTHRPEDLLPFIRRVSRNPHHAVWACWERREGPRGGRVRGRLTGNVGLHNIQLDQGTATLGYWARTSTSGRGYVTEAASAVLLWAFDGLGLDRVSVEAGKGNAASLRVIRRLGFVREGVMRQAQRIPSRRQRIDWVTWGMIRGDLRTARAGLRERCGARRPWEAP